MASVKESQGAPSVESEDFVCRSLAFLHVLVIVDAKNDCASERRIMTRNDADFPLPSETFSIATIKLYALKNCSELIVLQISSMATSRMCVPSLDKHPTALSGDYQPKPESIIFR